MQGASRRGGWFGNDSQTLDLGATAIALSKIRVEKPKNCQLFVCVKN